MKTSGIVMLVLKAVGMAMGIVVIVLSALKTASVQTNILLLGIGLFALGLSALSKE
jgi:hypothetical protein